MKLFYSNPFPRSTPFSKKFSRIRRSRPPIKYSDKLQRSQKRIRLCVGIIRINLVNPNASTLSSEEPRRHAIYWLPWLVPLIGIKKIATGTRTRSEIRGSRPRRRRMGVKLARTKFRRGCGYVDSEIVCQHPEERSEDRWRSLLPFPPRSGLQGGYAPGGPVRAAGVEPATFSKET
jgi:hypothetical protein